ncbi:MAG: RNase J family beta-CASP ribonuclease, partial [Brachybacterium tyrofermentans]
TVVALIDPKTNQPTEPLEFLTKGFVHDARTFDGAETQVTKALARAKQDKIDDIGEIENIIVEAVSNYLRRIYRREPAVMAVVVDA